MALSGGLAPARASQGSHRVSGCGQGSPRFRHNSHASRATEHERRPAPGVQPWARGLSISSLYLPRATCPLPRSPNRCGAGRPSSCGASLSPSLPQAKSLSLCLWSLTLNVSVTWEKMKMKMPEENQARRFSARCTVLCVGASRGGRQGRGRHLRVAGLPWAAGCTASPVGRGRPGLGAERGAGFSPCHMPVTAVPTRPGEENHMGWFCVEDDGNQVRRERHPLLVGHVPVTVAKQQEFKVTGRGQAGGTAPPCGPRGHVTARPSKGGTAGRDRAAVAVGPRPPPPGPVPGPATRRWAPVCPRLHVKH